MVQYSTTPTMKAFDGSGNNSEYALLLADKLAEGGNLIQRIQAIQASTLRKMKDENLDSYAPATPGELLLDRELNIGARITKVAVQDPVPPLPLRAPTPVATTMVATKSADVPDTRELTRKKLEWLKGGAYTFQVFWCAGPNEQEHFADAYALATRIRDGSDKFNVGRVLLQPLTEEKNRNDGYNVNNYNLVRFDPGSKGERVLADSVSAEFSDYQLLSVPGVGVRNRPTSFSVSAFVCNPRSQQ